MDPIAPYAWLGNEKHCLALFFLLDTWLYGVIRCLREEVTAHPEWIPAIF